MGTVPTVPISAADQFAAVLSAPLPFALAVVAVAVLIWKAIQWAYQWRYDGVIEQLNAMLRLAAEENRKEKDKQNELAATVKKLESQEAKKGADQSPVFKDLSKQLIELSRANTAVDDALRRGFSVTPAGALYSGFPTKVTSPSE